MLRDRKHEGRRQKEEITVDQRLTRRRSGLYPDLVSFEVAPRARLEPDRLRRVDLATPEPTACGEAFGFLVLIWMTPLSSWMLIVWGRRHREWSVLSEELADRNTLELARPEYLWEWILSKLALRSYKRQLGTYTESKRWHTASLEKRGPSGSRLTMLELYFWRTVREIPSWARETTYANEQPLEISGHCRSSASSTVVAGCRRRDC